MAKPGNCVDCSFYVSLEEGDDRGECHFGSPVNTKISNQIRGTQWPIVQGSTGWCSEYEEA